MNLKINAPSFEIHNKYEIKLFDKDGNLKQEAVAYNKANSLKWMCDFYNTSRISNKYLVLGSYKPEAGEADGRYRMFGSTTYQRISPNEIEKETYDELCATKVIWSTAVFPATTSYVGTQSEIGLSDQHIPTSNNSCDLYSHAWIVDAEGEPISITKTQQEEMQVTLTTYFTPLLSTDNLPDNFKFYPPWGLGLNGGIIGQGVTVSSSLYYMSYLTYFYDTMPTLLCPRLYLAPDQAPHSSNNYFQDSCWIPWNSSSPSTYTWSYTSSGSVIYNNENQTADYSPIFPIIGKITNKFISQSDLSLGYIHSIVFPHLGVIELPCKGLFDGEDYYTVKDISFEAADGERTNFYTNFNETVVKSDGTADIQVQVNGKKIDSDQYQFVQFDSRKSPLFNKDLYSVYEQTGEIVSSSIRKKIINYSSLIAQPRAQQMLLTNKSHVSNYQKEAQNLYTQMYPDDQTSLVYFDEEGISLDHVRQCAFIDYSNNVRDPFSFTLSYRNSEEEEWTDLNLSLPKFSSLTFERVTAKYWKIGSFYVGNYYSQGSIDNTQVTYKQGYSPNALVFGDSLAHDFTKVGLNFYEPPAEGSVITMDANLNLPYKTSESVMSFSAEIVLDPAAAHTSTEDEEEEDEE